MSKTFSTPPLFVGVKLHLPPPPTSRFVVLPTISDQSLRGLGRWGGGTLRGQRQVRTTLCVVSGAKLPGQQSECQNMCIKVCVS